MAELLVDGGRRPVKPRRATRLAWGILAVYVVLETGGLVLLASTPRKVVPGDEAGTLALDAAFALAFFVFTFVGALIASRRPGHPVGWLLCAIGLIRGVYSFALGYGGYALIAHPGALPGGEAFSFL